MEDIKKQVRQRYLDVIDDYSWHEEDPRLDFGSAALPYFMAAFAVDPDIARRCRLVRVIWQFRDPAALPILSIALRDKSAEIWKESLDGFVAIGGISALQFLQQAAVVTQPHTTADNRIDWINEAIEQIKKQLDFGNQK